MVEEQLVRGNLRWLANFSEIHKDYKIGDVAFPLYASGSLQEKGFFLSRIFSSLVTPRYKIHLLIYAEQNFDPKLIRKLVLACKGKFGSEDWIFLGLVQKEGFQKATKEAITNTSDKNVGIVAYSLASKERITSENVLGKGLAKQLKLTEAKFEAFDLPNYLKSFTITFFLVVLFLVFLTISGIQNIVNPPILVNSNCSLASYRSSPLQKPISHNALHRQQRLPAMGRQSCEGGEMDRLFRRSHLHNP